jgi:hypothetical protein
MLITSQRIPTAAFESGTGWQLKPEGACRGNTCVPLGDAAPFDGVVDVAAIAGRLGMPLVDHEAGLAALGPASLNGRALVSAEAPELTLNGFDGKPFSLSSLRGQKVVLVAWAPY